MVLAQPAKSPPTNTLGSLVTMDSGSTSGRFHLLSRTGAMASITTGNSVLNRRGVLIKRDVVLTGFLG